MLEFNFYWSISLNAELYNLCLGIESLKFVIKFPVEIKFWLSLNDKILSKKILIITQYDTKKIFKIFIKD